ncbi:MAG: minor capsid protein [FCB group bacterium]|nr:minor capsid protein [FCB group bacterium]
MTQAEQIAEAVFKSLNSREAYTDLQVQKMFSALQEADTRIKAELIRIKEKSIISKGLEVRRSQLRGIRKEIDVISRDLKKELSVISRSGLQGGFQHGMKTSIREFGDIGLPFYSDLSATEQAKMAGQVMSLIDRKALDFLVNYKLQLLGNVSLELAEGIKQQISIGLITGESISKISEKIGGTITDQEDFRFAGKTVFKTAQDRIDTITRTETLRAYGQGRHKFYDTVGVQTVTWLSVGDKRMCPSCRELDGRDFLLDKVPRIPLHPKCRCTTYAARARVCRSGKQI